MSELSIELNWQRPDSDLHSGKLSNAHTVGYSDNYDLRADAAPDWGGDPENTNPEQALAAALSSCHMLTLSCPGSQSQMARRELSRLRCRASW
jgi:organic hydroperoxide reductase OsmC/OhrA